MNTLNLDTSTEKLIENQFGDQYLFSVNQATFDKIDYKSKFKQDFGKVFEEENTLYLISGTDSGMMINHLLENPPEKGSAYIFVEFPEIIELIKDQYDLGEHKRIIVTTEDKWQEKAEKIGMDIYFTINKVRLFKSFSSQYNFLNEYLALFKKLEKDVKQLKWDLQTPLSNVEFIKRQLENAADNHIPAKLLEPYVKGKPALILAGGPSLDNYISWIEKNQSHYVVIAVSRIAKRLSQTKIKPDIFVSVDPHDYSFIVSKEIFYFEKNSLLINQYHVSPLILGNWNGLNMYLSNLLPWQNKLNTENYIGVGPTVTHSAIYLAIQLGISEQILFGVDLCYNEQGYSHAKGSVENSSGPMVGVHTLGLEVLTNSGQKAKTNNAFFAGVKAIEQLILQAKNDHIPVKNPSPSSAKIKGVDFCDISSITVPKEKFSIQDFLNKNSSKKRLEHKIKHCHLIRAELEKAKYKLTKVSNKANKAISYNNKLFGTDSPSDNYHFKLKMDKIEEELNNKSLIDFTSVSKRFGINELLAFLNPDNNRDWTNEEIKNSADVYYKAIKSGAKKFLKHIQNAINTTEIRLLELGQLELDEKIIEKHLIKLEKSSIIDKIQEKQSLLNFVHSFLEQHNYFNNPSKITKRKKIFTLFLILLQNGLSFQTRRLSFLQADNPDIYNQADSHLLIPLKNKIVNFNLDMFKGQMESTIEFGHSIKDFKTNFSMHYNSWFNQDKQSPAKTHTDKLDDIEYVLMKYFNSDDLESINSVIISLTLLVEKKYEGVNELLAFAKGLHEELKGNMEQAIFDYSYANSPQTLELALNRILTISLNTNEFEHAYTCLDLLINISPIYLPQMARLHCLAKNYKAALDIYAKYLDFNPKDITILYKMAEIYEEQKILDGAQFIYQEILKIDPDNLISHKALKSLLEMKL